MKDLWIAVSGAIAQQKNAETIANNVANSNTPGFKRDQLTFKEYISTLEKGYNDIDLPNKEWQSKDFYHSYGAEKAMVKVDGSYTNHEQGALQPTKNPLDLAIQGKGFFEVLTPNGVRYTRHGIFSLDNQNRLVTNQGHPVLSQTDLSPLNNNQEIEKPSERFIKLDKGSISINLQGQVFQKGNQIGKISIIEFQDIHALKKEGNSFFINSDANNIKRSKIKSALYQGFVEGSNVNAIVEMSNLIKAHRNFESVQKVIKAYDEMTGRGVNEISKF